jgi:hypothetical protein
MLHKMKQQILQGRLCPFKRVLHAYNIIQYTILYIIPECVAKVSGFALEAWGLRRARSTLLLCPQPFASDCREGNIVVPMARSEKVVTFGGSKRRAASFRAAGAALCDIPTCFITCPKSFCVTGAIPLRRCQKMSCIFRCRRGTLETSIIILHGRRGTLDVSCCVFFCKSRCQGCMHVFTLHTLHFTLHTLHLTLTITLYTPHFTL